MHLSSTMSKVRVRETPLLPLLQPKEVETFMTAEDGIPPASDQAPGGSERSAQPLTGRTTAHARHTTAKDTHVGGGGKNKICIWMESVEVLPNFSQFTKNQD